jgi:parallel beta-helix repeat protein
VTRRAAATILVASTLAVGSQAEAAPTGINACQSLGSGSYVLTADLSASGDCLVVGADFVTIDLAGFAISGNGTGSGVTDGGDLRVGIAVRGGTVRNFVIGIALSNTPGAVVEEMRVLQNAVGGMNLGPDTLVRGNLATGNGGNPSHLGGIHVGGQSLVTGNTASGNQGQGLTVESNSTVTGNTVSGNTFNGLVVNGNSTVSNNTASGNGHDGLAITCAANVVANTALGNVNLNLVTFGSPCSLVDNLAP